MKLPLTILHHAGNPNICRIPELEIRKLPECEGGDYYIPREQAEAIVRALNATKEARVACCSGCAGLTHFHTCGVAGKSPQVDNERK